MIKKTISILFSCFLAIYSPTIFAKENKLFEYCTPEHQRSEILNLKPHSFKEDGRPRATVGVILYSYDRNGEGYILLARERIDDKDQKSAGKYSEFGGSIELNSKLESETFLEASLRELKEESAGTYKLTKNEFLKNTFSSCYQNTKKREVVISIGNAPLYISSHDLSKARNNSKEANAKDKDEFRWLSINDLLNIKDFIATKHKIKTIDNLKEEITFRSYFLEYLQDPNFRKILQELIMVNHSKQKAA